MKKIILSLLFISVISVAAYGATLNVYVKDQNGNAISGAKVMLITHTIDPDTEWWEPDPSLCQTGTTDSSGLWGTYITVEQLEDGRWRDYQLLVTKQGYSPTTQQQMMDWQWGDKWVWFQPQDDLKTYTKNVTFTSGLSDVGTVQVRVNYSAFNQKIFFGEVRNSSNWETASMEVFKNTTTTGAFSEVFTFSNIKLDGSYRVSIFCPEDDKGMERSASLSGAVEMNMTDSGMAPPTTVDQDQDGNVVFEGVMQTTANVAIPDIRVMLFDTDNWNNPPAQTITDSNGYFAFYDSIGLTNLDNYKIEIQAQGYEGKEFGPFLYDTSSELTSYYSLGISTLAAVSGIISGTVTLDGVALPNAHINVWGDWHYWTGSDYFNFPGKGSGNAHTDDGTFEITGLALGNYRLEVYSDFTQEPHCFTDGADRQESVDYNESPPKHNGDDYRITVTTNTSGTWIAKVYDASGNDVTVSSYPLTVNIPGNKAAEGKISGTITYSEDILSPDVILEGSVIIIARQDWSTYKPSDDPDKWVPPACGFTVVNETNKISENQFYYEIDVPLGTEGYLYNIEVKSKNYAVIREGGHEMKVDMCNGDTEVTGVDFIITPGGTIRGIVKLPDGSIFRPIYAEQSVSRGCSVNADGWDIGSWGWAEVKEDGTFEINGLVPGKYNVRVNGWGGAFQWASPKLEDILVKLGGIGTEIEIKLKPGVRCYPNVSGDLASGSDKIPQYGRTTVIGFPAGTKMNHETMKDLLFDKPEVEFYGDLEGWWEPRFIPYGTYDFYACFAMDYGEGESHAMYFTFVGEAKGIEINEATEKGKIPSDHPWWSSGQDDAIIIDIDTKIGDSSIEGKLLGDNVFRQSDAIEMAKNFDLFLEYIPSVVLYDPDGKIKAWALEVPVQEGKIHWEAAVASGDVSQLKQVIEEWPPHYYIEFLPSGTYTFIAATPNYPPFVKQVEISGQVTQDVNFDTDVGKGGTISGVVKDKSTGNVLQNATIQLTSKVKNKTIRTNTEGAYEFPGLPKGMYTLQVSKNGYALSGTKRYVEKNASVQINFNLESAPGSFSGTVYLQRMPSPRVYSGAKITAYDDTFNGLYPQEYLPLYSAATDIDGKYTVDGVIKDHVYKIFLIVDGKQLEYIEGTATGEEQAGYDFVLRSAAPELDVKSKVSSDGQSISFTIVSPKTLKKTPTTEYQEGTEFNVSLASTNVTLTEPFDNNYRVTITPPKSDVDYVLRIIADDGVNEKVTVDTVFNLSLRAKVKKELKDELAEGGDVYMDNNTEDLTSLGIPTGGLTATEESSSIPRFTPGIAGHVAVGGFISTLPGIQISKSNRNVSTILMNLIETILASDLYTIDLTNAQVNRDLTISLNYDKTSVTDLDALKIYQYDSSTGQWNVVPGTSMVDPITGTISVDVDSISNASGMASPRLAGKSHFNGVKHAINSNAATDQTGTFAVFSAPPPNVKPYTGTEFKAYNFPNPFNLENKTLSLMDDMTTGVTLTTRGTIIKYYMPSSVSGKTAIYIYNLAGEMVRQIDEGDKDGGYIYYTEWDGRNDNGSSVASGVYFCMVQVNGKKEKLFKMAVIK